MSTEDTSLAIDPNELAPGLENLSPGEGEMWKRTDSLEGRRREIARLLFFCSRQADAFTDVSSYRFAEMSSYRDMLLAAFGWRDGMTLEAAFAGDASAAIKTLLGDGNAEDARDMWIHARKFPYDIVPFAEVKWDRNAGFPAAPSTLRSAHFDSAYIFKNIVVLLHHIAGVADGFSLAGFLSDRKRALAEIEALVQGKPVSPREEKWGRVQDILHSVKKYKGQEIFVPPLLGIQELPERRHRATLGCIGNLLEREIRIDRIPRVLMAGYFHALAMYPLSEGSIDPFPAWLMLNPSEAVVESQGAKVLEAARTARPKELAQLLGLVRAMRVLTREHAELVFCWWTGLKLDAGLFGLGGREGIFALALHCLTDAEFREKAFAGEDAPAIYLALWALGGEELADAREAALALVRAGTRAQVAGALYFTCQTGVRDFQEPIARAIRERRDFEDDADIEALLTACTRESSFLQLVAYRDGENDRLCLRVEKKKRSIMELQGLGKEIWEGIDAQEYVNRERDSWDK